MKDKLKRKSNLKIIWYSAWLFIIIQFLIQYFFNLQLFVLGMNVNFVILSLILFLLLSPIFFFDYTKHNILKRIYKVLSLLCSILLLCIYMFFSSDNKYFYFNSPNHKNTLVVEETSSFLIGDSYFYERKYGIFLRFLGSITTDDGYRPFSNDSYKIKWLDENKVQLDYNFGSSEDAWETEIINFK